MVSKLHRVATGRLDTGVGQQSNDDDVRDAVLFQLLIKVRVRESTLAPVLFDYYIAVLRRKIRMPFSAPFSARETMVCHDGNLSWVRMAPGFIVSGSQRRWGTMKMVMPARRIAERMALRLSRS